MGRRTDDDERQIKRWRGVAGEKGRWKRALVNRVLAANKCAPSQPSILSLPLKDVDPSLLEEIRSQLSQTFSPLGFLDLLFKDEDPSLLQEIRSELSQKFTPLRHSQLERNAQPERHPL